MGTDEQWLILVHGTFDVDASDEGERWWQRGSEVAASLERLTPGHVVLPPPGRLFRWSGLNSERERHAGGVQFCAYLHALEREGRRYHIVAHSHGGTVVWDGLREHCAACERGIEPPASAADLPGLLSVTTIGTPFMHYRHKPAAFRCPGLSTGILVATSIGAAATLAVLASVLTTGFQDLIGPLAGMGDATPMWVRGLFFWKQDVDKADLALRFGLIMLVLLGLLSFAGLSAYGYTEEARQVARDERLTGEVLRRFGPRISHAWSRLDEAIHGLQTTIETRLEVIPELRLDGPPGGERLSFLSRMIKRLILGPLSYLLRPAANRFIERQVKRAMQGADRPFSELEMVSAGPDRRHIPLALPFDIDEDIRRDADIASMAIPPQIRTDLAKLAGNPTSVMSFLSEITSEYSPRALMHTGYFSNDLFLEFLAAHITARSTGTSSPLIGPCDATVDEGRARSSATPA